MLRYATVSEIARFLARRGKQFTFYKPERMQQAESKIGLEVVDLESQLVLMTVLPEQFT